MKNEEAFNLERLKEELKELMNTERGMDFRAKNQGCTHKVVYWYHPRYGDDEQRVAYYSGEPGKRNISGLMRGSENKTDFTVSRL